MTELRYYPVHGQTAADVRKDIFARTPSPDRAAGYTEWHLSWTYRPVASRGPGCAITQARVRLSLVMTLPEWSPAESADPDLAQAWSAYSAALRSHEMGHVHRAVQGAGEIVDALDHILTPACMLAGTTVDQTARFVLARLNQEERAYDSETIHGRVEGADLLLQLANARASHAGHITEPPAPLTPPMRM